MGKFSYDDYMNLKKKGLVSWDDDLIKGHSKNLNDFVKGTSSLTEESFDDNVSKLRELEDQHRYVQTYINSLEGSGSYNGAKRSFDSIDATLNKAKGFYGQFKDSKAYGEALKQQKEAQAAEKQAKAQADEYRYNSKYQDFSYDELTRASKSTAPNLDESERNWLKKAAQNKATAQEYYEKELAPIEARMKELDEQYMQTHYSTPEMQNEYAKLRKQLDEKENIYKQKKDNQAAVNNAVEKREESARLNANLSRKYLTPATGGMSDEQAAKENESYLNRLIEGFYNSNDDKEREWIKERIKSGGFGSKAVEKAMNELYERSDDEAKRISGEYVYDGYETKKKDIIQSSQKKYADAAYMLENVLHPIKRAETSSKYMSLSGNKDFEANSNPDMIAGFTKREDRGELDNKRYMTDDEYKVYTYVYNTQGPEKAEEFFKSIEPELNKKMTEAQAQKEADLANSGLGGAIAASVKSLGYNFISGGGFIEDVVNYAAHKEVDTNSFLNLPANLSNAARQTVQKNIDNPVGQWIYGTTMSIADNAINMLVSKGIGKVAGLAGASASTVNNVAANATSIIMGSQVATQTVIDCKDKGLSDGQALGLGLIHGLVEHITEKVSIENILSDPRTFKQALKKSFVSEGSEEVAANWLDRAADALIMGDKSKERQDFENFKAQGMSDIEAFGQVMLGCLGEDAEAFLAGGVSGIVMSGVSHGFDKVTKGIVKGNEFNKIAEEASKKTDFDERKKELIKEAKESGDKKAVKMAESFERTIERHNGDLSAIKVGDVANIMRVLDDARQNAIESGNEAAAEQQSTVDSIIESSARTMERSKIANKSFNDIGLGAVKGKRVNLNAFGASHPKGIRVTQNSNPSISHDIVRIESSAKEYGEKENTVVLKTSDGRYINADEVTMPTKTYDTLIREAKNYDTNGARGLLANYEGYADYCKRSGKEADVKEYIQQYDALYDLGRHGVRAESMRTGGSARFNSIADAIGIEQAENALNTGANDADAVFMHENNVMLKMRMPGQKHAADSKVVIDVSEGEELNISDDQKNILQAIAQKTGRTIVLTDKLSENVNGTFAPDGRIYINSKIENSNYGVAVALHEAIHGLRTAAPMEYNALKKFIVNYLVEQGENIDDLLDDIAMRWGDSAASEEARLEELVAQSVMALATDDAALKKAIECEENKKLLNKVLDAIKSIAEKVREFIKGTLKDGKITGAHNKQAQFWTENLKALDELAEKFSKAMDVQRVNVREYGQKNNTSGEVRYSFGGERARNADKTALATAKQLDADGKSSEEIRQKTGWHKGYDGKWRFEIDDSMAKLVENPPLKLQGNNDDGYYRTAKLGDVLEHSKLFEAYPQLKNVTVIIQETEPGVEGISFNESKQIVLSQKLFERTTEEFKKLQESKQEEIKRIEQTAEYNEYNKYYQMDFSSVETPEQWLKEEKAARDKFFNSELGKRYYQLQWGKTNVQKTELGWSDKALSVLMHEVQHQIQKIEEFASGSNGKNKDYYNTAGEVEARDVQQRLNLNAEQRQKKRPDIDRDEVVFSGQNGESFEIREIDSIDEYIKTSPQEVEERLNNSDIYRTSKDNNKNNLRIRKFLEEQYPNLTISFKNNKNTGETVVTGIEDKAEAQAKEKAREREYAVKAQRRQAEEIFYKRVKSRTGNNKLFESIEKHLEKEGFEDAIIERSHSVVGTLSFYIEGYDRIIKISDHNTVNQELEHPDTYFIDIKHRTSFAEVWNDVKAILSEAKNGAVENGRKSVDDSFEDRDLVAVHNLSEEKLQKGLKLGGMPMPSIAVTKHDSQHEGFGDISLFFTKDTINPDTNSANKVYSGDAWTPMYPKVEYKLNQKKAKAIQAKAQSIGYDTPFFNPVGLYEVNLSHYVDNFGTDLVGKFKNDYGLKNVFLKDTTGKAVEIPEKAIEKSKYSDEVKFIADKMPLEMVLNLTELDGKAWLERYEKQFVEIYNKYLNSTGSKPRRLMKHVVLTKAKNALDYLNEGDAQIKETIRDEASAKDEIDNRVNQEAYEKWLEDLFDGIVEKSGVYNGKSPYTQSGNLRSFEQLHYEETLENVVKLMKNESNGESSWIKGAGIFGVAAKSYGTFREMKSDEKRIREISDEEHATIKKQFTERFYEIVQSIAENNPNRTIENPFMAVDAICENVLDAIRKSKTKSGMLKYLRRYYPNGIANSTVDDILDLVADIGNMPTRYFESKPQRAVGFDEVKAAVLPSDTSEEVKTALREKGISVQEYERGSDDSRAQATQAAINTKFTDIEGLKHNDLRFAVDDEITDDLFDTDGDLFEPENKEYLDKFIKTSPDEATLSMYNSLSKTGESVIKEFKGIKLSDENYRKAARRLMKDYDIKLKLNPGTDVELADRIKNFVLWFEKNPNANYNEALNVLADDCKGFLLLSGDYVDSFKEERQDLLSRLKGRTLVLRSYEEDQILENFGGIKGLRRAFFGKANVGYEKNAKGKPKVYIEDLVEEFSEQWGKNWASEDDIDSFAGWAWLDNMLNNVLKPKFVNPYTDGEMSLYRSIDAVAVEMAMQITDELVKEKADAAAKSKSADKKLITELRKKERAAHSAKEALEKSKKEKYKKLADEEKRKRIEMSEHYSDKYKDSERKRIEQNERFRERIREVEGKNKEYRRIIFDSEKSIRERYIEAREKTRYRKLLAKEFERMTKRLDGKAKNNEYIPEKLKKPILDVLNLFEVVPEDGKNLPAYWAEYRNLKDVGKRIDAVAEEYRNLSKGGKTENVFGDQFNADTLAYDEAVEDALSWLGKQIKGKNVYALNAEELKNIYNGMQMLDSQLKKAVEVIIDGKVEYINELAERAVKETQSVYFKKGFDVRNWAIATHLDPVRYGRFLSGYHDDYVTAKLFRDLHDGDKKRVKIIHQAFVDIERTLSKEFTQKELRKLQTADVERFEFVDRNTGKRVKISDAMLLSIYLTDRQADGHRQLTNDKANHYTVLPDLDLINRDDIPFVGKTYASATKAHSKAVGEKSHQVRFTENDLREIREYIDSNAKLFKLAEAVSSVFNGLIKDEINKVSLQRYGKMIATVKNYFPIVTDKNYPGKKFEVEVGESLRDVRIKSRSFTKQRTHAYNALMIDDVFNVFLKHVQETAEYCGMLIPVENFKRVYGKGNDDVILSKAIENKFGGAAAHYISKLMDDIQKPKDTLDQNILTRLHGNYMGAVLMINPGAAVKQFAAFPTAFKYFGVSNVAKAVPVSLAKGKSIVEKYSEYTPYMWYREKGNGTVVAEVSKQLSLTNRLGDSLDIMGKVDRFVVNSLLYAAEEHVSKTRSDLEFDSEEFKKEVARQFERAVDESQPNNMVTSKPQFVRNQVLRTLSLNAFISQNMAMGNGIIDSGMEYAARIHEAKESKSEEAKKAKHEAGLKFASHVIGTVLSGALLGLLKQLADLIIYHKWDDAKDEEGKTSWLKIAEKWRDDSLEAIVGAFAQGDYIYNTLKTLIFKEGSLNNLEVMSLGTVNDILKNVNKGNLYKAWGLFVDAAGLPLLGGNNIQRMLKGLTLTGIDFFVGDSSPFEHTIFKNNGELDTQFFGDFIVDYMKNGNKEEADKYVKLWQNELVSSGKSENEAMSIIKNKIAAVLTQTDSDVTDAFVAHMNGDTTKYKKLFDKLEGYGFDPSDIDKAIDGVKSDIFAAMKKSGVEKDDAKDDLMGQGFSEEAANKLSEEYLKPAKEQKESAFDDTSEGKKVKFSNKDGLTALKNGDKKTYEQIREYIVEHDSNVESNEAFDKMMRSLTYTGDIVDGYLEAMDNKNEAEREKYKKQLINIYGSWDDAGKVVLKRDKNKRKKK